MYEPNSFEESFKRPEKGKKVRFLPEDYVVIDLETTGLNPEKDEIIEIGAVRVRRLMITDTYSTLVYPQNGIDPFITRLTGITPEMVSDAPCISEALLSLMNFVKSDVVIGHNVHFDINFLYDKAVDCFGRGFSNNYVDTMQLSQKLFPEYKHHSARVFLNVIDRRATNADPNVCTKILNISKFLFFFAKHDSNIM